ncbi:carboxypeptidase-like regulatory domain-containing protein, partial [Flavobacteriaceae bacterium]|nr:carboxypeptidase-like regulatory domain-containing protein [Flavobacteriaceae bacterium]
MVYDLHDNLPLEGVSVTLVENNSEIQTIANGKFVFTGLCEQSYMLLLEHPDCVPVTIKVNSPSSILKRFYLEHHLNELEEIIITEVGQK